MMTPTTDQDTLAPQPVTNTVALTTQISTPQKEATSPQTTQKKNNHGYNNNHQEEEGQSGARENLHSSKGQ